MAGAKQDLMTFLSSCVEEIDEAVLVIRTSQGVAVVSSVDNKKAQELIKEGVDFIGLREKSGFNRNYGNIK